MVQLRFRRRRTITESRNSSKPEDKKKPARRLGFDKNQDPEAHGRTPQSVASGRNLVLTIDQEKHATVIDKMSAPHRRVSNSYQNPKKVESLQAVVERKIRQHPAAPYNIGMPREDTKQDQVPLVVLRESAFATVSQDFTSSYDDSGDDEDSASSRSKRQSSGLSSHFFSFMCRPVAASLGRHITESSDGDEDDEVGDEDDSSVDVDGGETRETHGDRNKPQSAMVFGCFEAKWSEENDRTFSPPERKQHSRVRPFADQAAISWDEARYQHLDHNDSLLASSLIEPQPGMTLLLQN